LRLRIYQRCKGDAARRQDRLTHAGKEADITILDATRINVAPLNQAPGAVVSLMDRTIIETVTVGGEGSHVPPTDSPSREYITPPRISRLPNGGTQLNYCYFIIFRFPFLGITILD
jgi:hypothetical protein